MKAWVGSLIIVSMLGFCVCFAGAANGSDGVAMCGFILIVGGLFGALFSVIVAEMFDV